MIINFENFTHELTEKECKAVPRIIQGIVRCVGEKNAVKASQMSAKLAKDGYGKITGPRIRKIMNFIRSEGIIRNIVATSKGYFIATKQEELDSYRESVEQRAKAMLRLLNGIDLKIQSEES